MSGTKLMKGHTLEKGLKKLTFPCYAEVKEDEIRCRVFFDKHENLQFESYAEKPLHNLAVFAGQFRALILTTGMSQLDIGVLVNKNFNDSYRWVRSKKVPSGLDDSMVEFLLFDLPDLGLLPFDQRRGPRTAVQQAAVHEHKLRMRVPLGTLVTNKAGLDDMFVWARSQGYEGLMAKTLDHLYVPGTRSYGWLKMKPEAEADGKIIAVNQAISIEGKPLSRAGSLKVLCEDGSIAEPAGIGHELGEDMFLNPDDYIGQWVMFKYMERDRQGGYRHPSFVRLREEKA